MAKIRWSTDEQKAVARRCVILLCSAEGVTYKEITTSLIKGHRGFLTGIFVEAQNEAIPEKARRRTSVVAYDSAPWLIPSMLEAAKSLQGEAEERLKTAESVQQEQQGQVAPATETNLYKEALNTLASLIAPLIAEKVAALLQVQLQVRTAAPAPVIAERPHNPLAPVLAPRERKLRIALVGLLPQQIETIKSEYGDKFDLRGIDKNINGNSLCEQISHCTHGVFLSGKESHAKFKVMQKHFDRLRSQTVEKDAVVNLHLANGGVSSVRHILNSLSN